MAKRNGKGGSRPDEHAELLRGIWNEIKTLGQTLGGRIDRTNERLEAVRTEFRDEIGTLRTDLKGEIDQLRRVMVESDVRLATAVTELAHDVRTLTGAVGDWRREHREDREETLRRVSRLEDRAGIERP